MKYQETMKALESETLRLRAIREKFEAEIAKRNAMPIEAFHAINGKDAPVPEVENGHE